MDTPIEDTIRQFKWSVLQAFVPTSKLDYSTLAPGNITPPPTTSKDYGIIQEALQQQNRQLDSIKGDGNCLFRSISKELLGNEKYHTMIRGIIVDFTEQNSDLFKCLLFSGTMAEPCKEMRQWGKWGSHIELQALSCLLQVEVYIFSPKRQGAGYEWGLFKPQSIPHSKLTFPHCVDSINKSEHYHMELCYTFAVHYDRVVPRDLLLSVLPEPPQLNTSVTDPIVLEE